MNTQNKKTKREAERKIRDNAASVGQILFGALLIGIGIGVFYEPGELAPGGLSGLSVVMHELLPSVDTGTWILILNVPVLLSGAIYFGLRFFASSLCTVVLTSLSVNAASHFIGALSEDILVSALFGSVLCGIGVGAIFRTGSTTGGTDIIVKLLKRKFAHLSIGHIFLLVDGAIVVLSGLVFGKFDTAVYGAAAVLLQTRVLNAVVYKKDRSRIVYIISEKNETISRRLLNELGLGATYITAHGAYSGKEYDILMCVIGVGRSSEVYELVRCEDEGAFVTVSDATEVFGERFKPIGGVPT